MPSQTAKPAILISRLLPKPAVDLARSRAEIDAYAVDGAMPRAELLTRLAAKRGPDLRYQRGHRPGAARRLPRP